MALEKAPSTNMTLRRVLLAVSLLSVFGLVLRGSIYIFFSTPTPVYILDKINLRHLALPDLVCDNCNNFDYDYIIENKNVCGTEDVFLLTFVTSAHVNVNARNVVRKTWGAVTEYRGYKLKTVFVFGTHLDKNLNNQTHYEQNRHGDIIQANFADHYHFLTNKSVLSLRWVTKNCPQAKYILKTDDDSFNIPKNFVDYLLYVTTEKFIGGYCFTVMPDRRVGSKFHVTKEQYPDEYYPTYCAGPGYILSQGAARDIVSVAHNTRFIPMEDVFVTGMCRVVSRIQYTEIAGVVVGKDEMSPCNLARWVKNGHNIVPEQAQMFWDRFSAGDEKTDCATRNMILYVVLLVFICGWARFMYGLHVPMPSRCKSFVIVPCPQLKWEAIKHYAASRSLK